MMAEARERPTGRTTLASLYLLRVPLITWLAAFFLGPFCLSSAGATLLQNLLYLDRLGIAWVAAVSVLLSYSCVGAAGIIIGQGRQRFGGDLRLNLPNPRWIPAVVLLIPASLIVSSLRATSTDAVGRAIAAVAGILIGTVLLIGIILMAVQAMVLPQFVYLGFRQMWPNTLDSIRRYIGSALDRIGEFLGPGYSGRDTSGSRELFVHFGTLCVVVASVAFYSWIGDAKEAAITSDRPDYFRFPTLAFVLVVMIVFNFALSGLTFLFDHYRVPLLVPAFFFVLLTVSFGSDHYFETSALNHPLQAGPAALLSGRNRVIVVAAAGGGVQAAGWTSRVLSGLSLADERFDRNTAAISAVSGGSVGVMYYANALWKAAREPGRRSFHLQHAFQNAVAPSLDGVAWALLSKDLKLSSESSRTIVQDRGWALERLFAKRTGLDATLSDWAPENRPGVLPALIFNATSVETGSPVVFSTTRFPSRRIVDFVAEHGRDVKVITAVRVSASFPFVSPVARPQLPDAHRPAEHLADGGYFDNFGTATLMEWLRDGMTQSVDTPKILVVRVVAFPKNPAANPQPRSWLFQIWAPMTTMLNVRTSAQSLRSDTEFEVLRSRASVEEVTFRYRPPVGCREPSLSWDLNEVETGCLEAAWKTDRCVAKVTAFLADQAGGPYPPDCEIIQDPSPGR